MNRILIAEDESRIVAFLTKGLQANGFMTATATNGHDTVSKALDEAFDVILLDLGLPYKDGLTVLEELRGQGITTQIIILTARDDVSDKVKGLELGADDYVTKPFRFEELLARIRARLRNAQSSNSDIGETTLLARHVSLDLRTRQAHVGDRVVDLSAREFILAETFFRHPNQVLSRAQLLDHVWGYGYDPGSNIVDVYVGYLRKKLGSDLIETVRGMGYRLVA